MNRKMIDKALHAANRMAADRGIELEQDALMRALIAVTGDSNGQDDPEEIAEGALELLGKADETTSAKRGRRPF